MVFLSLARPTKRDEAQALDESSACVRAARMAQRSVR
jgi:hypothetical protein